MTGKERVNDLMSDRMNQVFALWILDEGFEFLEKEQKKMFDVRASNFDLCIFGNFWFTAHHTCSFIHSFFNNKSTKMGDFRRLYEKFFVGGVRE